ncbi:germin-like protein 5-1 [Hibiscus syriacus]|uniref:Germin-like protein 5-1 n=1 Tax=Hibiscus syriacus TaxID=106335 RepID=A0A6A2X7K4_HIBSY|nr:germin-like protein 5-1 [Hibiscus syriacus]
MGGDVTGTFNTAASTAATSCGGGPAEPQYVSAKTSVWWDIENCQQALSSTGIALNHVPAGVKDASDKKILVDMFWAVDNPAPANYLLISGDRDFSNALHQLRMRRYNILLAQPMKASVPLVAAAKSVWLWMSLSAGGPPLSSGESTKLAIGQNNFNFEMSSYNTIPEMSSYDPIPEMVQYSQQMVSGSENVTMEQNVPNAGRNGDSKYKGKYIRKTPYQPSNSRASSVPKTTNQENMNNVYSYQPEYAQTRSFKKAPHEFFGGSEPAVSASRSAPSLFPSNPNPSGSNNANFPGVFQNHHPHSMRPNILPLRPAFAQDNLLPPNSQNNGFRPIPPRMEGPRFPASLSNMPDVAKLNISEHSTCPQNGNYFPHSIGEKFKKSSIESLPNQTGINAPQRSQMFHSGQASRHDAFSNRYPRGPEFPSPSSSTVSSFSNGVWGAEGHSKFNTSSFESLPNQTGINAPQRSHMFHSGQSSQHDTFSNRYARGPEFPPPSSSTVSSFSNGVWGAEGHSTPSEYVQGLIGVILLALNTLKNEKIMPTEANITDCIRYGDPKHRNTNVRQALDSAIEQHMILKQSLGQYSSMMASQCRYEAASALRKACLEEFALGDVLQILNMIIAMKKWIHHQSGWQPITITLPETNRNRLKYRAAEWKKVKMMLRIRLEIFQVFFSPPKCWSGFTIHLWYLIYIIILRETFEDVLRLPDPVGEVPDQSLHNGGIIAIVIKAKR